MISKDKRIEMKKVLGFRYAADIAELATKKGITNTNGKPFSPNYITQVLNGRFNNNDILFILFDEYKRKKRLLKKQIEKLNKL